MDLRHRVRDYIRRHALAGASTRVVAAVSGGSDSVALAQLLSELASAGDLQVAGVAHFNHQLRRTADAEERFVRDAAQSLGWPVLAGRGDVAARARDERRSLEDAAHQARHEFFETARAHFRADVVALGHTRDDQAETVLLRLLRGAGPRGLAAMHPRRGSVVRPLLECRRAELREYLRDRGTAFVEDESNADLSIPRNRIRAELLPLLEDRFNPNVVSVLADQAELARETADWLDRSADDLLRAATYPSPATEQTELEIGPIAAAPPAVRRFAIWRAMSAASGARRVAFAHVDETLRLMHEERGSLDAPGVRVDRIGSRLVLTGRPPGTVGRWNPENLENRANLFSYSLSIPGEVALPEAGCVVSVEAGGGRPEGGAVVSNPSMALVRRDLCAGRLTVRNRRPGDKFRPIGLGGRKKLQDFFVDRRVARPDRDRVPLVVDEADRIVWVAGYGIDEAFRVTDPAQAVLILRLKHV